MCVITYLEACDGEEEVLERVPRILLPNHTGRMGIMLHHIRGGPSLGLSILANLRPLGLPINARPLGLCRLGNVRRSLGLCNVRPGRC